MPTVLHQNGFRFYFWSNEGNEPAHIHVTKADGIAKYWLDPKIKCHSTKGFTAREIRQIEEIINENYVLLINEWNEK